MEASAWPAAGTAPIVATFERVVDVEREAVWAVLADPKAYGQWVSGAIDVTDLDDSWPAAGAVFAFNYRGGPLRLSGHAAVEEAHPPGHMRIRWSRGPFADSLADVAVGKTERACVIRIEEHPRGLRSSWFSNQTWSAGPSANAISLERLERLARRHHTTA